MTHHWGFVGVIASSILFGLGTSLNKLALAVLSAFTLAMYLLAIRAMKKVKMV